MFETSALIMLLTYFFISTELRSRFKIEKCAQQFNMYVLLKQIPELNNEHMVFFILCYICIMIFEDGKIFLTAQHLRF